MRALVTGSEGFIGRHIHAALRALGRPISGIDLKRGADCLDFFLDNYSQFDVVFHCAAYVNGRESIEGRPAFLGAYNLQLDAAMWQWALKTCPGRVVYFSSSAAYPRIFQTPPYGNVAMEEWHGSCEGPRDATYGETKRMGELLAAEVRKAGVPVTVVRPFSGYGEDQDECYPFPAMIARAKRGDDPFAVWGDGRQVRDFVHVDDIVGAVLALVEASVDGPVNIGTGVGTSMDDLARLCMETAGYEAPIYHLSDKPSGVRYRVADTKLLRNYYEPKVTLGEGVRRALSA